MSRHPANQSRSQQGIALVSVLAVTVVTVILAAIFSYMVLSERRSTNAATVSSSSLQLADAATERARMKIIDEYANSFLSSQKFIEALDDSSSEIYTNLNGGSVNAITVNEAAARWQFELPPETLADELNPPKWIDISATAETGDGVQTVVRRINMGQSDVFNFAMLSENTDCMYCHLQVYGDVGSFGFFRPGHEGVGSAGAGGGSNVNGDLYVAPDPSGTDPDNITDDDTSFEAGNNEINGGMFKGDIYDNYMGSRFPEDDEGNVQFPPITRLTAKNSADGKITGGEVVKLVTEGSNPSLVPSGSDEIEGDNEGNVVLIGTKANPIKLDGDVYFSGDVVIKGYVEGKGGVYAGRNVYVAGDIRYVEEPEDCRFEDDNPNELNDDPDECARESLDDGANELRIAARGNVVLGDYTETEGAPPANSKDGKGTEKQSWQSLNAADYFREQFGFNEEGNALYYDESNGDELELQPDGTYENADGDPPEGDVSTIQPEEAYDYSMRPGKVTEDGGFESWLSDDVYQQILGKQMRAYDTWRKDISREEIQEIYSEQPNEAAAIQAVRDRLGQGAQLYTEGEPEEVKGISDDSIKDIACAGDQGCDPVTSLDLLDQDSEPAGQVNWRLNAEGESVMRVILDAPALYESQTNRVDAFLYANKRIAGKTFNAPLAINGGLVAKDIGVLAPGVQKQYWQADRYNSILNSEAETCNSLNTNLVQLLRDTSIAEPESVDDFANGYYDLGITRTISDQSEQFKGYSYDCALTVNYDYRMRNGGLGFNLVAQDVGRTVSWRVGSNASDRVAPPQ